MGATYSTEIHSHHFHGRRTVTYRERINSYRSNLKSFLAKKVPEEFRGELTRLFSRVPDKYFLNLSPTQITKLAQLDYVAFSNDIVTYLKNIIEEKGYNITSTLKKANIPNILRAKRPETFNRKALEAILNLPLLTDSEGKIDLNRVYSGLKKPSKHPELDVLVSGLYSEIKNAEKIKMPVNPGRTYYPLTEKMIESIKSILTKSGLTRDGWSYLSNRKMGCSSSWLDYAGKNFSKIPKKALEVLLTLSEKRDEIYETHPAYFKKKGKPITLAKSQYKKPIAKEKIPKIREITDEEKRKSPLGVIYTTLENILEDKPYHQETAFNTLAILGQVAMGTQENVKMKGINLPVNAILFDLLMENPKYKKPLKHYFRNYKEAIKSCFLEGVHDGKFNLTGFKAHEKRVKFLELFVNRIKEYLKLEIKYSQLAAQPVYATQTKKESEKKETVELFPFVEEELKENPDKTLDPETKEPVPRSVDEHLQHMIKTRELIHS